MTTTSTLSDLSTTDLFERLGIVDDDIAAAEDRMRSAKAFREEIRVEIESRLRESGAAKLDDPDSGYSATLRRTARWNVDEDAVTKYLTEHGTLDAYMVRVLDRELVLAVGKKRPMPGVAKTETESLVIHRPKPVVMPDLAQRFGSAEQKGTVGDELPF